MHIKFLAHHEHGWDRPDDPERARLHRPGPYRAYIDKAALRAGLDVEPDPRRVIGEYLTQAVERGTVRDRASLVADLHEVGLEVPRQGKNYVTALDPQSGQRWRLKGAMYAWDFELARLESANRAEAARGAGGGAAEVARGAEQAAAAPLARKDAMLQRAWLRTLTIGALKGLILVVGILLGISGLTRWLAGDIQSQIAARSALVAEIAAQRETVRRLEEKTWGITLRQLSNGRFVVLPADSLDHPPWTVEGKPAVKLSSD